MTPETAVIRSIQKSIKLHTHKHMNNLFTKRTNEQKKAFQIQRNYSSYMKYVHENYYELEEKTKNKTILFD